MTLFGNLPPPEPTKGREPEQTASPNDVHALFPSSEKNDTGETSHHTTTSSSNTTTRSWALPEFIPNLRRPHKTAKTAAPSTRALAVSKGEERKLLSPKHPHSLPQNPEQLISKWNAAEKAGEMPVEQPARSSSTSVAATTTVRLPRSLAEYLPTARKSQNPRHRYAAGVQGHPSTFYPFEEYNPMAPNSYQVYKDWMCGEKQRRAQRKKPMLQARSAYDDDRFSTSGSGDSDSDSKSENGPDQ